MLVDGPSEWAETSIPAGNKLDLLQHAYNEHLGVVAVPKDATVVLVRFSCTTPGVTHSFDEVMDIAEEEVVLHPTSTEQVNDTKPDVFRYVAWSSISVPLKKHRYVAIATVGRVEIWRVDVKEALQAVKIGTHSMTRIRGICWNTVEDTLLVYGDLELTLVEVTETDHIQVHPVTVDPHFSSQEKTKQCVWDSSGRTLARSTEHKVYFLTWPEPYSWTSNVTKSSPVVSSYSLDTSSTTSLLGLQTKLGSITAMAMLSKTDCIIATDVPLVLEDMKPSTSFLNGGDSFPSGLLSTPPPMAPASSVIDLTSLRTTATSRSSLLNILDQPKTLPTLNTPSQKRTSHVTIISNRGSDHWKQRAQVQIDHITTPDVLDIVGLRIVVGSTISHRLTTLHLEHSLTSGWSLGVSGELELPEGHVCRGLRMIKTSPFVQVASTEKVKRTFFHASSGPQRIQLSKFKLPRRRESEIEADSNVTTAAPTTAKPAFDSKSTPAQGAGGLSAVLGELAALQALMVSRFDQLERRIDDVCGRLDRLEVTRQENTHSFEE